MLREFSYEDFKYQMNGIGHAKKVLSSISGIKVLDLDLSGIRFEDDYDAFDFFRGVYVASRTVETLRLVIYGQNNKCSYDYLVYLVAKSMIYLTKAKDFELTLHG